ncbi:MAG TPA: hypothetical protein VF338_12455 [Leptolinea sp.]
MPSSEERFHVLKMIQEGKITAEEGVKLLDALERGETGQSKNKSSEQGRINSAPRWMRVVITDLNTKKEKINIRLPANVLNAGHKLGARFAPNLTGLNSEQIFQAVQMGETGKVIDICDEDSCERVVISLE